MQEHDFLQAICESPDDVAPRLVYADWLDEQGDPRGEFIRVQCERETLSERDPRCRDLDFRSRSLLAQYRNVWARPVRKWSRVTEYHRGFVEDITLRTDAFLESGEELLSISPVRRVKLTHLKDQVEALAACPLLSRIHELSLRDTKFGLAKLKVFLKSPWIKSIQGFDFSFNGLSQSAVREILATPSLGPIKSLALDSCKLGDRGLSLLLESDWIQHLQKLEIRSNNLNNDDAARIADCPRLRQLKELHLDFNSEITNRGIRRLLESENLPLLEVLSLRECRIGHNDDQALAFPKKTALKQLVRLDLENVWVQESGIGQIAESAWADDLVHLNLSKNYGEAAWFDRLFQPGRFPLLRSLGISWNRLNPRIIDRLQELATSDLTLLDIGADIGNKGVKALAQSGKFSNLNILIFKGWGITDPGAKALAKSETLNRITELRMTTSASDFAWNKTPGVSDKVVKSLIDRFGKHVCYFD